MNANSFGKSITRKTLVPWYGDCGESRDKRVWSVPQPKSILIVDDEEAVTGMMADFFRSEGFEVQTALSGVHGYSCYFRHPTEWVVTDIQMPDLDGIEMMRCIRAINPSVKTVYVSGAVDRFRSVLESEKQQFGAIVLNKPFPVQELTRLATPGRADTTNVDLIATG